MPEGAHPLGWQSLPFAELDGQDWPLSFAARHLGLSEEFLRAAVKELEVEPSGVIRMSEYRRQGRQPKCYPAKALIRISETMENLREMLLAS